MVAKNDYSRYFFNSLYDDELISNKIADYQNHMYDPILRGKSWIQNNRIINGDITDIQVNQELNLRYGMPMDTFSIFLNINIVPFYSEKEFYFRYGYEKPITTSQIMDDDKTFSKYMYFFMSGYLIHDVEIVVIKGGHTIIFIHPTEGDKTGKIHKKDLNEIMTGDDEDGLWTIMFSTRSDVYKVKQQRSTLFTDNKIYLKHIPVYKKYNKPNKNNCYTLYITSFASSYNIMSACSVTVGKDEKGEYFLVPKEFKDYIYKRTNLMFCMIFNEPDCSGSGIYVDTKGDKPIFQIPYKKNPIPIKNILIWQYDSENHRKIHPLEVDVSIKYPNIYDFSRMIEASYYTYLCDKSKAFIVDKNDKYIILRGENEDPNYDLYIEWIEPKEDCMLFNSYIQDYIDYYPNYCDQVVNDTLPKEFTTNFDPITPIGLGAFDYYKSKYYGDYRAWRLSVLSKILHNNPKKYDLFYHEIYTNIRNYLTRCYTYKDQKDIYDRSIDNNYDQCINDKESRISFDTPHTYLHIQDNQTDLKPMNVFIGGKLSALTFAMKRGNTTYAYIDRTYIEDHQSIQLDLEIINKSIETAWLTLNNSGVDLASLNFRENHSLSNLILFDEDGNYISKEDFTFQAQMVEEEFSYTNKSENLDSAYNEEIDFYTRDGELFVPAGSDGLIVQKHKISIDIKVPESSKDTKFNNMILKPKSGKYNGNKIGISTTDFCRRRTFFFVDDLSEVQFYDKYDNEFLTSSLEIFIVQPDETTGYQSSYTTEFKNFRGKPSLDRIKVYADGKIVSPKRYEVVFEGYNKNAVFHFHEDLMGQKIDIHYFGYDDELIYDGEISPLLKTDAFVLFLRDIIETPYDKYVYKIFIDGYRISDDKITMLGQSNMLYINSLINSSSNIMIYRQKMDDEIYGYTKDTQFLDITAQNDPNFLKFLIDKYTSKKSGL